MRMQNAKQDVQFILSWFSGAFSSPSFKLFSCFIVGFIQLGKDVHTSSMVQSLSGSFLQRSLSCFTRFLGKNAWAMEEVLETALHKFFYTLRIKIDKNSLWGELNIQKGELCVKGILAQHLGGV